MQLDDNIAVYEFLLIQIIKAFNNANYLEAAVLASIAGQCAWHNHAGFYTQTQVEEILLKIGRSLDHKIVKSEINSTSKNKDRKILHVFSYVSTIGGHTRLIERWISNRFNNSESHSVLSLGQGIIKVPEWLKTVVNKSGGTYLSLPDTANIIDRSLMLRKISYEFADVIVLHTNPNDPIPLLAFAFDGGPPVVLFNHADHVFWYGSSIADLVADIRPVGQQLSLQRRKVENSRLLPIPLLSIKKLNKSLSRNELHLPDDKVILLSIAASYKFYPYKDLDFPKVVSNFIKSNLNTILIVIGPSSKEPYWQDAIEAANGRIRVLGPLENIDKYYEVADIYLESFPVGSLTSALDAALHELPVIQAPTPMLSLLHMDHYIGMQGNAVDITTYYDNVSQCVYNKEFRTEIGKIQKQSVEDRHTGSGWQKYIDDIMNTLPVEHRVRSLTGNDNSIDKNDEYWAELQSISTHSSNSALLNLIVNIRGHIKFINKFKLLKLLAQILVSFGIFNNKQLLRETIKTFVAIILPMNMYKKLGFYASRFWHNTAFKNPGS